MKIAVYGSLREGLSNHSLIESSEYVGQFETPHMYNLLDLGAFPGLTKNGSTSVVMDVYEVNSKILKKLDALEGYRAENLKSSFYIREKIDSPLGQVSTYFLNKDHPTGEDNKVSSGDWTDYYKTKRITKTY
jgi:gamma-glutamylcyclotransferase (GGCT)/AIG2-like uncharacterized protein YtfP